MEYVIIGLIVLLVLSLILTYNKIIAKYELVTRAWSDIHTYERQKVNILEELAKSVSSYISHESDTFKAITSLRSSIKSMNTEEPDAEQLAEVQKQTDQFMRGMSITLEAYPELKANSVVEKNMDQITIQNENVGAAIAIFNRNVQQFNTYIQSFPVNLVNGAIARKTKVVNFRDSTADQNIEYKPNF